MARERRIWTQFFDYAPFDLKNKTYAGSVYVRYMFNRTLRMFEYENLPETITAFNMERLLQVGGHCAGTMVDGKPYLLTGGLGGEPDAYYLPTEYTVANPALRFDKTLKIGVDCVLFKNDSLIMGLKPMFNRYATLLAENDITLYLASINTRIQTLITADDDSTKASAEEFIRHIVMGDLGIIAGNAFLDGIKSLPYLQSGHNQITQLIELEQYLKAGWFNDIGLQANYNMKREAINSNEAQLNNDALFPLIDDMEQCRKEAIEQFNEMYGFDIKVKRAGVWESNEEEMKAEVESLKDSEEEQGGEADESETESGDTELEK